ncbi:MAG: ATP-binding protein [Pirellulaceae bacterium]
MSIHRRLLVGLLVGLTTLFAIAGSLLYFHMQIVLLRQFDTSLAAKARAISGLIERQSDGDIYVEFTVESMPEFGTNGREYFSIRRGDGSTLARSPSLGTNDGSFSASILVGAGAKDVRLPDGRLGRAIAIQVTPTDEDEEGAGDTVPELRAPPANEIPAEHVELVVVMDRGEVDRTMALLWSSILAVAVLLVAGTATIVTVIVRRGLRPLDRVASQAASIDESSLAHRFNLDRLPSELQPICLRLNELLQRLEVAFQRERRFAANIAHELRTPIAELRSLAEVVLKWPDDPETSIAYFHDVHEIARQMEATVITLLSLARCQSGRLTVSREQVLLSDTIREVWDRYQRPAADKGLAVVFDVPADMSWEADRAILDAILANLMANSVEHTSLGGTITIRAEQVCARTMLTITNDCEGLTAEDLPHLFEPFWRKDAARTDGSHCGLGLTLVKDYCQIMEWDIRADILRPDSLSLTIVAAHLPKLTRPNTPVSLASTKGGAVQPPTRADDS